MLRKFQGNEGIVSNFFSPFKSPGFVNHDCNGFISVKFNSQIFIPSCVRMYGIIIKIDERYHNQQPRHYLFIHSHVTTRDMYNADPIDYWIIFSKNYCNSLILL